LAFKTGPKIPHACHVIDISIKRTVQKKKTKIKLEEMKEKKQLHFIEYKDNRVLTHPTGRNIISELQTLE